MRDIENDILNLERTLDILQTKESETSAKIRELIATNDRFNRNPDYTEMKERMPVYRTQISECQELIKQKKKLLDQTEENTFSDLSTSIHIDLRHKQPIKRTQSIEARTEMKEETAGQTDNTWQCPDCSFLNGHDMTACEICDEPKPEKEVTIESDDNQSWPCSHCTVLNPSDVFICTVCAKTNEEQKEKCQKGTNVRSTAQIKTNPQDSKSAEVNRNF